MEIIQTLPLFSRLSLYGLLAIMAIYCLLITGWQILVLRGKSMKNVDGSFDNWKEQKNYYGIAFADLVLACPANLIAIALIFIAPRWGFYLLALVSFWWMWANIMSTATSLRFEQPKITLSWLFIFPFGIIIGALYIIWTIVHFEQIYAL